MINNEQDMFEHSHQNTLLNTSDSDPVFDERSPKYIPKCIELNDSNNSSRSEAMLNQTALNMLIVGTWELDLLDDSLFWSDTIYHIYDTLRIDFHLTLDAAINFCTPDFLPLLKSAIQNAKVNGIGIDLELEIKTGRGKLIWVHMVGSVTSEQGRFIKLSGAIQDISEQKIRERELAQARSTAEQASDFKSLFLSNLSHEIRTTIAIIHGYTELLAENELDPVKQLRCNSILRSSGQLELLTNDILDISKIEAGKISVDLKYISVSLLLAHLRDLVDPELSKKGIQLTISAEGAIPSIILTDPLRLKQILLNIIGNAIKFTNKGGVDVRVLLLPAISNISNQRLAFVISDTGIGICPEQRLEIFKAFGQANSSISRKFGGMGLGLTLSLGLAHLLGGDIVVSESEIDKGSTFTVTIDPGPLEGSPLCSELEFVNSDSYLTTKAGIIDHCLDDMKILIVEDAEDIRYLIRQILETRGALVSEAADGEQGITMTRSSSFDLILMDIKMPVLDGFQAIQQLRSEGFVLPICALTAQAMKGEREICLAKGFSDYLPKPIKTIQLLALVNKFRSNCGITRNNFDPVTDSAIPARSLE